MLAVAYAVRSPDRAEFLALVCAVAATPVVAAVASMLSGECVARGAPVVPIAVQAMRSLVPAVLLLVWPGAPLVAVRGRCCRSGRRRAAVVLGVACRRLRRGRRGDEHADDLTPYGLVAQAVLAG